MFFFNLFNTNPKKKAIKNLQRSLIALERAGLEKEAKEISELIKSLEKPNIPPHPQLKKSLPLPTRETRDNTDFQSLAAEMVDSLISHGGASHVRDVALREPPQISVEDTEREITIQYKLSGTLTFRDVTQWLHSCDYFGMKSEKAAKGGWTYSPHIKIKTPYGEKEFNQFSLLISPKRLVEK